MHDVNKKEFKIGDYVNIPCKVVASHLEGPRSILELELKYHEDVKIVFIQDILDIQVVKSE